MKLRLLALGLFLVWAVVFFYSCQKSKVDHSGNPEMVKRPRWYTDVTSYYR